MMLFDSKGVLRQYGDVSEIMKDFVDARRELYETRKVGVGSRRRIFLLRSTSLSFWLFLKALVRYFFKADVEKVLKLEYEVLENKVKFLCGDLPARITGGEWTVTNNLFCRKVGESN